MKEETVSTVFTSEFISQIHQAVETALARLPLYTGLKPGVNERFCEPPASGEQIRLSLGAVRVICGRI
jgi:hypothetical protein